VSGAFYWMGGEPKRSGKGKSGKVKESRCPEKGVKLNAAHASNKKVEGGFGGGGGGRGCVEFGRKTREEKKGVPKGGP